MLANITHGAYGKLGPGPNEENAASTIARYRRQFDASITTAKEPGELEVTISTGDHRALINDICLWAARARPGNRAA